MNEAFEKILERLEEELRKSEERYYRYLDDSNLPCMFDKSDIEEKREPKQNQCNGQISLFDKERD